MKRVIYGMALVIEEEPMRIASSFARLREMLTDPRYPDRMIQYELGRLVNESRRPTPRYPRNVLIRIDRPRYEMMSEEERRELIRSHVRNHMPSDFIYNHGRFPRIETERSFETDEILVRVTFE